MSGMTKTAQREVVITGFGGQGIILTGSILGKAATIGDNKHATMTQSYGPEARGGSCSTQVIVSRRGDRLSLCRASPAFGVHEPGGL